MDRKKRNISEKLDSIGFKLDKRVDGGCRDPE